MDRKGLRLYPKADKILHLNSNQTTFQIYTAIDILSKWILPFCSHVLLFPFPLK